MVGHWAALSEAGLEKHTQPAPDEKCVEQGTSMLAYCEDGETRRLAGRWWRMP